MPKVSVCIPSYNPGGFLRPAIASVLEQDFTDFECVIVDDCSSQPIESVVAEFSDERINFRRNSRNLGLVGNWNHCLEVAQGEYVTVFHQDDVMLPGNLARKVAILENNPTVGLVYSNIQRINETGQVIGEHYVPQPEIDMIMQGWKVFEMVAAMGNPIACQTVIVRKECYERLGKFDTRLPFATDLEMWMRIARFFDVGYLAQPLVALRVHSGQETTRFDGTGKDYLDVLHALELAFSHDLTPAYAKYARKAYQTLVAQSIRMARWKLRQGQAVNGLRYITVAIMSLQRAYIRPNT